MSKIIKYNDYIQVNPDQRILTLDRVEKIQTIDKMLMSAYSGGKGLVITYDLSHSGRRINNRIYSTKGQQRGIDSLTNPYPKPILKNHDQKSEPIGRFTGGEWQDLYDEASSYLESTQKILDVHNAFNGDDPGKIYHTLKSLNLIKDKQWPGLGRMRVQANITDEEAIKKFMDGRYFTFSAGSTTDRHVCSICESDWAKDGMCEHRHGEEYDGETCVFITGDFIVMEGSVVNTPADDLSQLVHMEMRDSEESAFTQQDKVQMKEIILTDSIYLLGDSNETKRIQATEQIDAYEEKGKEEKESSKEKVKQKYDHEMIISDKAMTELHQAGETYITQKGDGETMVIKVKYSGQMRTMDSELFTEEYLGFEELVEELLDEKTFKVPSGAKGNAQKVLNWKKEKGSEVKGMTPVGWARARQLASKSEIGLSTVKRMAAFNRHRKNAAVAPEFKSTPWKDRGYVAWLGWGGTSGIDWAIRTSAANDNENEETMIADFDQDAYRSSPKGKGAKTPAKPSERIKGSKKNKKGSASKASSGISVGSVLGSLKEKVRKHNKKHGKEKGKRVSLGMLKAVYRRGAGAFSSTHRPGMSRSGWGVARVNAFLKLVRSGRPSNPKYVQDNDLLPAGHSRKSSNKEKKAKDFIMNEEEQIVETEEIVVEDSVEEIVAPEDEDLLEEAEEPSVEEQEEHDESFEEAETLDQDSEEIDWELLDMGLSYSMMQEDAALTSEQRKELPESAFCGPNRSFPVPDCAHVSAARKLIGRAKVSGETKQKIMACVNSKAGKMSCDKDKDYLELESRYSDLLSKYNSLEEKLSVVIESIISKNDDSVEKITKSVENDTKDEVLLIDVKVENPSEHVSKDDLEQKMTKAPASNLGNFEQKVVDTYSLLKKDHGELAAEDYLMSKIQYLPRGFHPNNI